MTKFLLPLLALGAAVPAVAASTADKPISFERDGIRYVATVRTTGDTMIINGREQESGTTFQLRSANGRVSGTYGSLPVNYTIGR